MVFELSPFQRYSNICTSEDNKYYGLLNYNIIRIALIMCLLEVACKIKLKRPVLS